MSIYRFISFIFVLSIFCVLGLKSCPTVNAYYNPLSVPNNKFGIHIIDPSEISQAKPLVNSSGGDWGYVVVVMRSNDRDKLKWQHFFDIARENHIIPIIRLATVQQQDTWAKPTANDASDWANFLSTLRWPSNNHYIVVYNEPNHAQEWGGSIDPAGYAHELARTISALKAADQSTFVLNAGFDASAPTDSNKYMDEEQYLQAMNQAEPGIFQKLDGWVSHSYPQPNFSGNPFDSGRNTITTYRWEEDVLQKLGVAKKPVFITETGWAHNEGVSPDPHYLSDEIIAQNFTNAYTKVWNDSNLVVIAPFTLVYHESPFDHFSWLRLPDFQPNVLGAQTTSEPLAQFNAVAMLQKTKGVPLQSSAGQLVEFQLPKQAASASIISGKIVVKNTGESIWFDKASDAHMSLTIEQRNEKQVIPLNSGDPINPGQTYTLLFDLLTSTNNKQTAYTLTIANGDRQIIRIPATVMVMQPAKTASISEKIAGAIGNTFSQIKKSIIH